MSRSLSAVCPAALSVCAALAVFQAFGASSAAKPAPAPEVESAEPAHVIPFGKPAVGGHPVSFSAAEGLVWQGKDGVRTFQASELRAVAFEPKPAAPADPEAMGVLLASGDLVTGKRVSWTRDQIELDTGYAGQVRIPMAHVRALTAAERPKEAILDGFGEQREWGGCAILANGVLRNNGQKIQGPMRRLPLPDQFRITFNLGRIHNFAYVMVLGRGEPMNVLEGTHEDYTFRITKDGPGRALPPNVKNQTAIQDDRIGFQPTRKVQVTILGDLNAKTCYLLLNGSRVYSGVFPAGFAPGKCLGFPATHAAITAFKLSPWNGALSDAPVAASDKDALVLANGERESGRLQDVKEGFVHFAGDLRGLLKLPVARIARVELAGKDAPAAPLDGNAVEVACGVGDHLVLAGWTLKDGMLQGEHPVLGKCTLRMEEVRRLGFAPAKAVGDAPNAKQ